MALVKGIRKIGSHKCLCVERMLLGGKDLQIKRDSGEKKKKRETVAVNTLRELKAPDSCITTVLLAALILTFLASHRVLRWVPHLNIH